MSRHKSVRPKCSPIETKMRCSSTSAEDANKPAGGKNCHRSGPDKQNIMSNNPTAFDLQNTASEIDSISELDSRTDTEQLIDNLFNALEPCDECEEEQESSLSCTQPSDMVSYEQQINLYRNIRKRTLLNLVTSENCLATNSFVKADILIVGDSMIKSLKPKRLNRSTNKKVICCTMRGAKIEDLAEKVQDLSTKHCVNRVVFHAGTNNIDDSPDTVVSKISSLCETVHPIKVTVSSIIHRRNQSLLQKKRLEEVNELLKSISSQKNWGYIDNRNITLDKLASDGVHLNQRGVGSLAKNIIQNIVNSTGYHNSMLKQTQNTSYTSTFQLSNQYQPHRKLSKQNPSVIPMANARKCQEKDWRKYLRTVRQLLNPLYVRGQE